MSLLRELLNIENEYLIEAPMRIAALVVRKLQDPRENRKLFKTISQQKNKERIGSYNDDVELWKVVRGSETEIYALLPKKQKVGYYVRWERQASFIDGNWNTQILVWAGTNPETKDLPEYIFFNFVVEETGVVVSDGEQTERGELFWKRMIGEAFRNPKFKVYLVDFNAKNIRRIKTEDDYDKLLNSPNDPWGPKAHHKGLRLAISDFDFTQE